MTKNIIFIIAALCSLQARADVQPTERDILYTARTVTMTQNCCSRYSPYTLTEWSFRHGETAIGLSVSPEVRQPFSARRSVAKTCSGG